MSKSKAQIHYHC